MPTTNANTLKSLISLLLSLSTSYQKSLYSDLNRNILMIKTVSFHFFLIEKKDLFCFQHTRAVQCQQPWKMTFFKWGYM